MTQRVIEQYGIRLRPMQRTDLEMIRQYRNRPDMRRWMTTDHEIQRDEMESWFGNLPEDSEYWIVEYEGRTVGQANLKAIGPDVADPGYMFWDEEFQAGGGVPRVVLALFSYAFNVRKVRKLLGWTACDNNRALRLAKGMGFVEGAVEEIGGRLFCHMELLPDAFAHKEALYKDALQ